MGSLQQQSVLKGNNTTFSDKKQLIHNILTEIATKYPNRTAILYEDGSGQELSITYENLNKTTDRLAKTLRRYCNQNNNSENIVAVCLKPTERLPIILTAILKSGMAYLPLDSEFPAGRIKHILNESQPALVIIEEGEDRSIYQGNQLSTYEQLLAESHKEWEDPLRLNECPEQLAIVLYTSGSTGIPKGVRLPHTALLNRLQWQWRELPFSPTEEKCIFKTALTFVDSAPEIWGPLLQGRTIVVIPRPLTKDPEKFVQMLEKHQIQRLVLVPSLLRSMLMYLSLENRKDALSDLKLWICSGETLSVSLAQEFFSRFGNNEKLLANFYGSTEVMGDVTFHLLSEHSQLEDIDKIPIGKPVDNSIVYIVNKEMRLLPQGEVGELVVAGKNLAAGYIRGRDAHKFLDNPHVIDPEYSVIFRTGDYARIDRGIVYYEGRTDSQIKIRGHRVDLSEVEKAFVNVAEVDKAVVLCYKPGELSQALVAFVTVKENNISSQQIESFMQTLLAPYMVPQVIIVDSIPLLTNGKTDRQTLLKEFELSSHNDNHTTIDCDYSGVPEEDMAKAEVLFPTVASVIGHSTRHAITIDSNFYHLGGNSLNSIYTVTKLKDQGYEISITDFITAKTMAEILLRMKLSSDLNSDEDINSNKNYYTEMLNDSHQNDVIEMITESFYSKADLEQWILSDILRSDYSELMKKIWKPLVEKNFSFVIRSKEDDQILSVALNFDALDEPEVIIESKLTVIFEFLEYLEGPIRDTRLPKGLGKIFHSFMMATDQDVSAAENVLLMKEMEHQCLIVARRKGFAGIFTTNTSPLTQQLGTDIYNYDVLLDYQVNQYVAPDGTKPFGKAPDDQRAVCSWKAI